MLRDGQWIRDAGLQDPHFFAPRLHSLEMTRKWEVLCRRTARVSVASDNDERGAAPGAGSGRDSGLEIRQQRAWQLVK
jgi:hypothetical protein